LILTNKHNFIQSSFFELHIVCTDNRLKLKFIHNDICNLTVQLTVSLGSCVAISYFPSKCGSICLLAVTNEQFLLKTLQISLDYINFEEELSSEIIPSPGN